MGEAVRDQSQQMAGLALHVHVPPEPSQGGL